MKFKISLIISFLFLLSGFQAEILADDNSNFTELDNKSSKEFIKKISSSYNSWKSVEINGKMNLESLFISPSVKIYMKKGEEVFITVRAFIGEAARLEIDRDSILIVNRMKHTYCKESLESITQITTITINDIQDIFLGRLFIAGRGTLNEKLLSYIKIYAVHEGGWLAVPKRETENDLVDYGFVVNSDYKLQELMVRPEIINSLGEISYEYKKKQTFLDFTVKHNDRNFGFGLSLDQPKWEVKPFERITFNSKYKRLGISDFLKTAF